MGNASLRRGEGGPNHVIVHGRELSPFCAPPNVRDQEGNQNRIRAYKTMEMDVGGYTKQGCKKYHPMQGCVHEHHMIQRDGCHWGSYVYIETRYKVMKKWNLEVSMAEFIKTLGEYSAIISEYGSDKNTTHSYGPLYEKLVTQLQGKADVHVLEIGIFSGAFLQVLAECLPHASIHGVDISLANVVYGKDTPNITMIEMSGTDPATVERMSSTKFDLIIEDGSHEPADQVRTLDLFAPLLKEGGVYVTEDIANHHVPHLKPRLEHLAVKHGLAMEWMDLQHVRGRYDDILAVFIKTSAGSAE
jgi:hypothetical protein